MYWRGINRFAPYLVTLIAILVTDLLKGIAAGIAVGLYFIIKTNFREIDAEKTEKGRCGRLAEVNVIEQVHDLAHTAIIQRSRTKRRAPKLHGWIYGLHDGIIKKLITLMPDMQLDPLYRYDLE